MKRLEIHKATRSLPGRYCLVLFRTDCGRAFNRDLVSGGWSDVTCKKCLASRKDKR